MLRGERVGLRARHDDDIPVLMAGLYDDVDTRMRSDDRPWVPIPPGLEGSAYRVRDDTPEVAAFSVVDLSDGDRLAGEALL
jgi:hypothetical protein